MGRQTILQKITDYILTGGRRTTAVNTRDVLTEMANTYMSVIHDTAANFAASKPILETKQIGVVSDSLLSSPQYKIGDGITHWNDLPYSSGGGGIPNLQQVLSAGDNATKNIELYGVTDGFKKVTSHAHDLDEGTQQVYDDAGNSTIELRGSRGFKVHDNAYSGDPLFEVIRDNGIDTDKVVINATTTELTQGTASKLLRLNASKEIVSSSYDEIDLLPETAATIGAIVNAATSATPNDTDLVMSVESSVAKKSTWTQIKAFLKTYFDTVYQTIITYVSWGTFLHAATDKSTPIGSDEVGIWDSVSGLFKRVSLTNLKTFVNYFKAGTTGTGSVTTILGSNDATANYSFAVGKDVTAYNYGEFARGSNPLGIKAQSGTVHFTKKTTTATITEVFLDGSSSRFIINKNTAYQVKLFAIAVDEGTGDSKEWEGKGLIKNRSDVTSLVGSFTMTSTNGDGSLSATSITVTADDTNDALKVQVTGILATIAWNIRAEYVRVGYIYNAPEPIGLILSNDFSPSTWTAIDVTGTYTFNVSDFEMSGNNSSHLIQNDGLLGPLTSCENSVWWVDVVVSATSRTGCGFHSALNGTLTNLFTDSSVQACFDNTLKATTYPTLLTWAAGNTLRITFTRTFGAMTLEISNITNPNTLNVVQALSNVYGAPSTERATSGLKQLFISNWRGTSNRIVGMNYSSTDWRYADVLFVGTSKTSGFYCDLKANRMTDLYEAATGKRTNNWATSSGTTATYLLQAAEIISVQPKAVYIEGPCNDVRNAVLEATIEANMNSFISQLRIGLPGVKIYVQLCWPELTGLNFTTVNAYLSTLAAADLVVIPTTGFDTATHLNADNIHINTAGQALAHSLNMTYIV